MSSIEQFIRDNYNKPGHAIAYSSPEKIRDYLKKNGKDLPTDDIAKILAEFDGHNQHKEYHRPRYFNPYYTYKRRDQIQADLIDVRQLARENDGVTYLFLLIDSFSKKIWVYPLKNKSGKEVATVFRNHLEHDISKRIFRELCVDAGTEFFNSNVKKIIDDYSIHMQKASGYNKTAIAERANKTIQLLIYKYMTENESARYIDVLDKLVKSYNNRSHRSLRGMTPNEADEPLNEVTVRGLHRERFNKIKRISPSELKHMFSVGDTVRIKKLKPKFGSEARSYAPQFYGSYFTIRKIETHMPRPVFHVRSMDDNEDIIGGFYRNELSAVRGNVWKIEKILESRGKGKNRQNFVKWKHFNPSWNSWIRDEDITATYQS